MFADVSEMAMPGVGDFVVIFGVRVRFTFGATCCFILLLAFLDLQLASVLFSFDIEMIYHRPPMRVHRSSIK